MDRRLGSAVLSWTGPRDFLALPCGCPEHVATSNKGHWWQHWSHKKARLGQEASVYCVCMCVCVPCLHWQAELAVCFVEQRTGLVSQKGCGEVGRAGWPWQDSFWLKPHSRIGLGTWYLTLPVSDRGKKNDDTLNQLKLCSSKQKPTEKITSDLTLLTLGFFNSGWG
jgi:hypothetical protein